MEKKQERPNHLVRDRLGLLGVILLLGAGLKWAPGVVITILLITICIAVHEFGHMVVMLRNGVTVKEYAIGFGAAIWQWRTKRGVLVSFRLIPLGGYVAPEESGLGSLDSARPWAKFKIAMAGMFMNALTGSIAMLIMMYGFDMPVPEWFPGVGIIPAWLLPLIAAPLITFGLWLGTPIMLIWIPLTMGGAALVDGAAGPIGIAQIGGSINMAAPLSVIILKYLFLFWMLSVGVAGMNLLPIMPLDGSYIPRILIEKWYAWRIKRLRHRYRMIKTGRRRAPRHQGPEKMLVFGIAAYMRRKTLVLDIYRRLSFVIILLLFIAIFAGDFWRLFTNKPAIRL